MRIWGLIISVEKCNTYFKERWLHNDEVFETLSDVFEELRAEAREREYSVQTEEAVNANATLKRENEAFQKWLSLLTEEDRTCIENYLNAIEHAHFQEEQRAYYQGMIDVIQIFMGLGVIKKRNKIEALLNKIVK